MDQNGARNHPAPGDGGADGTLQRHRAAHDPVSRRMLAPGNAVTLLPSGADALDAMVAAIEGAQTSLHLEYYEFEDVHWRGRRVVDLLRRKSEAGIAVAVSYDAAGSSDTDGTLFETLRRAGAAVLEFRSFNPLHRRFNPFRLNDRDHRKILVADGRLAILGGVNLSRVYENPRSAGAAASPDEAFWYDCAARIEGPAVAEVERLFLANWRRQGGRRLPREVSPPLQKRGGETVRVDGSAPRQHRQLYFESIKAAMTAARSHALIATGYFVPTYRQWQLVAEAAERGVQVDLVLAGYSDVPACTRAARALYGRLLERGVRIHEMTDGMMHAKVATVDGVWSAIGSSNFDRRSFVYNNEVDAIVLGRETAGAVEAMLSRWIARADRITLSEWRHRSTRERAGELMSRFWKRLM